MQNCPRRKYDEQQDHKRSDMISHSSFLRGKSIFDNILYAAPVIQFYRPISPNIQAIFALFSVTAENVY